MIKLLLKNKEFSHKCICCEVDIKYPEFSNGICLNCNKIQRIQFSDNSNIPVRFLKDYALGWRVKYYLDKTEDD